MISNFIHVTLMAAVCNVPAMLTPIAQCHALKIRSRTPNSFMSSVCCDASKTLLP